MENSTPILQRLLSENGNSKQALLPILQAIQSVYNYLPEEVLHSLASLSGLSLSDIFSVATFYSQFRLQPVGEHLIKVCVGTACHVKGAGQIVDAFYRYLQIPKGEDTDKQRCYTVDKVACLGCCTLAVVVQIDDITYGHVTSETVPQIIADFEQNKHKRKRTTATNDSHVFHPNEIRIGLGSCCVASGSDKLLRTLEDEISKNEEDISIKPVGCIGACHQVPLLEIVKENRPVKTYAKVSSNEIREIIQNHFPAKSVFKRIKQNVWRQLEQAQNDETWSSVERFSLHPQEKVVTQFLGPQLPIATKSRGEMSPLDFDGYVEQGGFESWELAKKLTPSALISQIQASGMRGRGGGGFPTGIKWGIVADQMGAEKYIVCNGDEGDPGAFMDRMLLESYPFRIIEGVLIAAKAIDASKAYFYIRAEYPLAVVRMRRALQICEERKLFEEVSNGRVLTMEIYQGAGAFVCGEETALLASMEGDRGFPKQRPPFPAEKGLFDKPTLINNTETFAMIPSALHMPNMSMQDIGTSSSKGTKVFSLTGKINRGGLIEVPMGTTIRQIVEEIGGGVPNKKHFKAVQIGGPSGGCIPARLADTPVDYESLTSIGAMMGSGGLVVLDEDDCMVDMARYFLAFTQEESCGKCSFCRIGTKRMLEILDSFIAGEAKPSDLVKLETLANQVKQGSLCNLGKTAPNPVLTTLHYFREEYEAHLNQECSATKCLPLITYRINDKCIGCTKCAQECPVEAISFTPYQKHRVDASLCIGCDVCRQVCSCDAINKVLKKETQDDQVQNK